MPASQELSRARCARHYVIDGPFAARLESTPALVAQSMGFRWSGSTSSTRTPWLDQADLARARGCDYGQGYLWSQPLPASVIDGLRAPRPPSSRATPAAMGRRPAA